MAKNSRKMVKNGKILWKLPNIGCFVAARKKIFIKICCFHWLRAHMSRTLWKSKVSLDRARNKWKLGILGEIFIFQSYIHIDGPRKIKISLIIPSFHLFRARISQTSTFWVIKLENWIFRAYSKIIF